jgi:hypothetical protein
LIEEGFFVALVSDLVHKHVLRPAEFARHQDVEFALHVIPASFPDALITVGGPGFQAMTCGPGSEAPFRRKQV